MSIVGLNITARYRCKVWRACCENRSNKFSAHKMISLENVIVHMQIYTNSFIIKGKSEKL